MYDRQIRLWGVEAQRRMRSSHVLFVGFRTLNAEVCKNIVLAGVSVTIQDDNVVEPADLGGNFFLTAEALGKNRGEAAAPAVQELNPLVKVGVMTKQARDLALEDLKPFSMVCVADGNMDTIVNLNAMCRALSIGFVSAWSFGWSATVFQDLGDTHTYLAKTITNKLNADGEKVVAHEPREASFCSLKDALSVSLKDVVEPQRKRRRTMTTRNSSLAIGEQFCALQVLQSLDAAPGADTWAEPAARELTETIMSTQNISPEQLSEDAVVELVKGARLGAELSPTCAVVGGIIGQELLKGITGKDAPVNNFFFFDGMSGAGIMRQLAPPAADTDADAKEENSETKSSHAAVETAEAVPPIAPAVTEIDD